MESLNQEELLAATNNGFADTIQSSVDQCDVDPLSPPSPTTQQTQSASAIMDTTSFTVEEEIGEINEDEFTANHSRTVFWSLLRYLRAILALLSAFVIDLTSADNKSVCSNVAKVLITLFTYGTIYTSTTGRLLWAIAYLMDHGWYLLAVTCSIVLLLGCGIVLALYEWMWKWQVRMMSLLCENNTNSGFNRLRSVNILDDDDMEDDLSLRAWIKRITYAVVYCLIWSLYCVLNVKVDFWINGHYVQARPAYYPIELRLVNWFEGAPILLGAGLLLYFAYPHFYRWNYSSERGTPFATVTGSAGTTAAPFTLTGDFSSDRYTILISEDDDEPTGIEDLLV
mmetsp:Transcript_22922/g.48794  ORF Transcript_22922/g.48794 Transcript_22922/m.48794 type:complete len:340 (+) Transcript_22922:31-1050(+)|eukprot:CAMPEP_0201260778 /NCGR_PEP_ID=MMETSP0853-20130426/5040_1 /ASSEMBLY_ACC=CAM_ASM_000640 /TAXON_ID=183588 /ORGANISM="Pseudo-nitzschia fraudulenta, Strain WWA7" /LENGTH=339 /DNA_ID=CAMNT_0047563513 /DNA_START=1 /DNA_END=1020 /DNA_ORIENTATION=+